jgi:predicted dehydrogenase
MCDCAGKPVFCEKPLAMNVADAKRAISACQQANIVLGIGR